MQMPRPDFGAGKVTEAHKCNRISEPRRRCMWTFNRWEEFVIGMSFDLDLDEHFHSWQNCTTPLPPFATNILNRLDIRIHQEASKIYHTYTEN